MAVDRACGQVSLPLDEERHVDPTVPCIAFAATKWPILRAVGGELGGRATVVAQEEDQGISLQAQFSKPGEHLADRHVEPGQHRRIGAASRVLDPVELRQVGLGRLERCVYCVESELQIERTVAVPFDESDGFPSEDIGQVTVERHRGPASQDGAIGRLGRVDVIMGPDQESEEVIESAIQGVEDLLLSLMPFADQPAGITCLSEHVPDRADIGRQALVLAAVHSQGRVELVPEPLLISA